MTWHLKARKLEEKIIGIDTDFSRRLNRLCEKWDSNKDNDLCKYKKFSVPFYCGGKLHGEVTFSGDEVEKVDEYNPKDWNSFPDVPPPENVWMRLEILRADYDSLNTYYKGAYFMSGNWYTNEGRIEFEEDDDVQYRPWED